MMPIKKRTEAQLQPGIETFGGHSYHECRATAWERIDREGFNFHGSCYVTVNGDVPLRPDQFALFPKKILFFKDVWHCGSAALARQITRHIAGFDDVRYIELKQRWVWVEWDHHGKDHMLPGQPVEDRKSYRGR